MGWEWAQEEGRLELEEGWRCRGECTSRERFWEHVQVWTKCRSFLVHQIGIGRIFPLASIQASDKRLEDCQYFCRSKGTVTGTVDEHLAQQAGVAA